MRVVRSALLVPGLVLALLLLVSATGALLYVPLVDRDVPAGIDAVLVVAAGASALALALAPFALLLAALAGRVPPAALVAGMIWFFAYVASLLSIVGSEAPGNPWDGPYGGLIMRGIETGLGLVALATAIGLLVGAIRHVKLWARWARLLRMRRLIEPALPGGRRFRVLDWKGLRR